MHTKLDERWTHGIEYVNMHLLLQIGVGGDLAKLPNMRIAISTASLQEAGHSCHCRIEKEQSLLADCGPTAGAQSASCAAATMTAESAPTRGPRQQWWAKKRDHKASNRDKGAEAGSAECAASATTTASLNSNLTSLFASSDSDSALQLLARNMNAAQSSSQEPVDRTPASQHASDEAAASSYRSSSAKKPQRPSKVQRKAKEVALRPRDRQSAHQHAQHEPFLLQAPIPPGAASRQRHGEAAYNARGDEGDAAAEAAAEVAAAEVAAEVEGAAQTSHSGTADCEERRRREEEEEERWALGSDRHSGTLAPRVPSEVCSLAAADRFEEAASTLLALDVARFDHADLQFAYVTTLAAHARAAHAAASSSSSATSAAAASSAATSSAAASCSSAASSSSSSAVAATSDDGADGRCSQSSSSYEYGGARAAQRAASLAVELINSMHRCGIGRTSESYRLAIEACGACRESQVWMLQLLARARAETSHAARADSGCFRAALRALRASRQWHHSQSLIEAADADGVNLDGASYAAAIGALSGAPRAWQSAAAPPSHGGARNQDDPRGVLRAARRAH